MLRQALLGLSRAEGVKRLTTTLPMTAALVRRFVAGEQADDAVRTAAALQAGGLAVSIDHLGEDTNQAVQADAVTAAYLDLLGRLRDEGLTSPNGLTLPAEVSVKLSAIGQFLPNGERMALENARSICTAAQLVGTTVTFDMEDHTTTDSTLGIVGALRADHPSTGAVIQAYLHRSEADCADLATPGSRVRLCKGAYDEPSDVAFTERHQVDLAYVRCLKVLMSGEGYPMIATHDPRLIEIALDLAARYGRGRDDFEFQMLHGVRPAEQRRLVAAGHRVRVYLPYGTDWYGYLVRRMAEKPANLALFLKSLVSTS